MRSRCSRGLERGGDAPPQFFDRELAKLLETPWMLATSEDCRYTLSQGGRVTVSTRVMQRDVDRVVSVSCRDLVVRRLWLEVFHVLKPPTALLGPRVLARVLAPRP